MKPKPKKPWWKRRGVISFDWLFPSYQGTSLPSKRLRVEKRRAREAKKMRRINAHQRKNQNGSK